MPIFLSWSDIAVRLLCAFLSGGLIGINRSEHGRAAGLRTSILVCLAACVAMIQVNLLLPLAGRTPDSFVMNDLMRLPLGILSGMGFIGAGAILRRNNFVVGVTTAATLWFLTVIGLCFGGGQIRLGIVGAILAIAVLSGLSILEDHLKQDCQGSLLVVADASGPDEDAIREILLRGAFQIKSCGIKTADPLGDRQLTFEVRWRAKAAASKIPEAINLLANRSGVTRIEWAPQPR